MADPNLFLVVMAGGSGTRFWPKSTSKKPKQLLNFGGASSLLNQTLDRFSALVPRGQKMIVTTRLLEESVRGDTTGAEILAEPQGRNTAPCVYWAARAIAHKNPNGVMLVMPADHDIAMPEKFISTLKEAVHWASDPKNDDLVTLGVKPVRPETGYGYLKIGQAVGKNGCRKVSAFIEKPNVQMAREFFKSGDYLWNGGMFVWRVDTILKAFDQYMPEMKKAWEASGGKVEIAYPKMPATSIDFGIMEKASNVVSFPLDCGWDDLGSWTSLENLAERIHAIQGGNIVTSGQCVSIESQGNIVDAPDKLVALLGIKDLIVVESNGAILIARKDLAQNIKSVVEEVKRKRPELT